MNVALQFKTLITHSWIIALLLLATACNRSILVGADNGDPAIAATVALEQGESQKAIDILKTALKTEPNNYTYISLLATAQAQLIGIDFLRIVLKMAENQSSSTTTDSSSSSQSNEITLLFGVVPEATSENIDGLDEAIQTMETIPEGEKYASDEYKLTVFYTARLALNTKKFDKDGDGLVSQAELVDLSDEDATTILESLSDASTALEAAGAAGATSEQLDAIQEAIDNQEGSTDAEKLKNYLAGSS